MATYWKDYYTVSASIKRWYDPSFLGEFHH